MSLRIIHLTLISELRVAIQANAIEAIQAGSDNNQDRKTLIRLTGSEFWVKEPYDTVLRMWVLATDRPPKPEHRD